MKRAIEPGTEPGDAADRASDTRPEDGATQADVRPSSEELVHRLDAMHQEAREQLKFVDVPSRLTGDEVDRHDESLTAEAHRLAEIDDAIRKTALHAVEQIEATLVRVRDGTYGRCVSCGKKIPEARLHAVPTATHCASCQSTLETRRSPAIRS